MAYKETNYRTLIKSSTIPGEIPTIPGSGATNIYDHTEGGWLDTDVYSTELFINEQDKKIWARIDDTIVRLGYSGETSDFVDLGDTPSTYSGSDGYYVTVDGTGLTFTELPTIYDRISNMVDFVSTPSTGETGYSITLDSSGTGFTLTNVNQTFSGLTDVISTYTPYDLFRVDSGGTYVENFTGSDSYVDFVSTQTIGGNKTFNSAVTFSNSIGFNTLYFTGLTDTITITDIDTSAMTSVNDNTLATTKSIYDYINTIIFGTGTTSNFVTTDTTQTITGTKTFSAPTTHFDDIEVDVVDAATLSATGNLLLDLSSYQYFGNGITDGSFRFFINVSGALEIQKRVSGTWTYCGSFDA